MFLLTAGAYFEFSSGFVTFSLSPPPIELLRERENGNIQIYIKSSIFPDSSEDFT